MGDTRRSISDRLLVAWWLAKKWAWRNTAGAIWLVVLYAAVTTLLGTPTRALSATVPASHLFLATCIWIAVISECQLTGLFCFFWYVLTMPLWLPILGAVHFYRHRRPPTPLGVARTRPRLIRFAALALCVLVYLWWPFPSRAVAIAMSLIALLPGYVLFRRSLTFALAPAEEMLSLRETLEAQYLAAKKALEAGTQDASAPMNIALQFAIAWYEKKLAGKGQTFFKAYAVAHFVGLVIAVLLFWGFLGALALRALLPDNLPVANVFGQNASINLLEVSLLCIVGGLNLMPLGATSLPLAASVIMALLRLGSLAVMSLLIGLFFSAFSAAISRLDAIHAAEEMAVIKTATDAIVVKSTEAAPQGSTSGSSSVPPAADA